MKHSKCSAYTPRSIYVSVSRPCQVKYGLVRQGRFYLCPHHRKEYSVRGSEILCPRGGEKAKILSGDFNEKIAV